MNAFTKLHIVEDHIIPQGSDSWKEYRKGKVGATVASCIMGKNPWKTALQAWEEMFTPVDIPSNEAMERGKRLEPIARQYLNDKYGLQLRPCIVEHPLYPEWHYSSLDGLAQLPDGSYFACEIKCPGPKDHALAAQGIIPDYYQCQLIHQLEDMPGVEGILYLSYSPESQHEIWFMRDEIKQHEQISKEMAFFQSTIDFVAPEACDRDWVQINDPVKRIKAERYEFLLGVAKEVEEEMESLRDGFKEDTKDYRRAIIGNLKIQRFLRKGNIQYSKIEQLAKINLEAYRKEATETFKVSQIVK